MHLFWWAIGIILIILIFARWNFTGQHKRKDTPLDILKRRFANGEINKDEFEEKKKILQQN
jgi:putative membrane protein